MASPVRSMTGFGSAQAQDNAVRVLVDIRSVNQKNLRLNIRSRSNLGAHEMDLRKRIGKDIDRGQVDLFITIDTVGDTATGIVNIELARTATSALRHMAQTLDISTDLTLTDLLQVPGLFNGDANEPIPDETWQVVNTALESAIRDFLHMRETEGAAITPVLLGFADTVESFRNMAAQRAPEIVERVRTRLTARIAELTQDCRDTVTQSIIEREVCIFADRADINEEIARLDSHLAQFRNAMDQGGPVGRRLEFLAQEMLREVNTIASKGNDTDIARGAVEAKLAVESIKEQVANLE